MSSDALAVLVSFRAFILKPPRPSVLCSRSSSRVFSMLGRTLREAPLPHERGLESLYPVLQLHVSRYAVQVIVGEAVYSTHIQVNNWTRIYRSIHDSRSPSGPCPSSSQYGISNINISDTQHFYRTESSE